MSLIIPKVKGKFFRFMARILPDHETKGKSNVVMQNSLAQDFDSERFSMDDVSDDDEKKTPHSL
eukprot:Pgem_evm1s10037